MPGHNGIISFLMSFDKADRFSKDVKLPSGQVGQVTILDHLAHYLDVSGSVIRGQNAKIASHRQEAFGDLYGFSDDRGCMDALRRENEDDFREAFTELRSRLKEATRTTQAATPRVVGALLEEDKDNPREQSPPSPFASLSLWMDQEFERTGGDLLAARSRLPQA